MSISLQKGQKVSLSNDNAGLAKVIVGLGWDEVGNSSGGGFMSSLFGSSSSGEDIDCDASAIMLRNGKFVDKHDVVYFGNLSHKSGSVNHQGDNLTGAGEGDDEQIIIDLSRVPVEYDKIVMVVNNNEMFKYNLTEDYSGMTAMIFGEIYRYNGEWKFSAIGQGTKDPGLAELSRRYM